jgi:phosphogluconate dehydratase
MGCANLAHGFAACSLAEKADLTATEKPNIAIVTAYNDMLSAHQPYKHTPDLIKETIRNAGGVAQWLVAFQRCVMASHKVKQVWSHPCLVGI